MPSTLESLLKSYKELEIAKSKYEKGLIKEKIRELEASLKINPIPAVSKEVQVSKILTIENTQKRIDKVLRLENVDKKELNIEEEYDTARIANITECTLHLRTAHSTHISQTRNSILYITAQQIRVYGCADLTIYAYTATGVFIEDSVNIQVLEYLPDTLPPYKNNLSMHNFNAVNTI
ncbi:hypothetical protein NEIRO03_0675 [Nematocida sp. AWRm78]|nr:hypothetical protein NEIRO03_0675 [Nematocida sp. AWRm78]